jgi:hypothetical protein
MMPLLRLLAALCLAGLAHGYNNGVSRVPPLGKSAFAAPSRAT